MYVLKVLLVYVLKVLMDGLCIGRTQVSIDSVSEF